jgi:AP-1-like factor
VNSLEQASNSLQADNERLKRELAKYTTENEILRATSRSNATSSERSEPTVTGPMKYSPTDFYTSLMPEGTVSSGSGVVVPAATSPHRVTICQITGEKLLDASATWDFIQGHELFKRGQVDIGDVTERLKGLAQCNGQGPAFKESEIRRAVEESAADRDELI